MAYFTKQEAREAARSRQIKSNYSSFETILNENIRTKISQINFDIFLSHSSQDAELVLGVVSILENLGYSVYVDWINDKQLSRENINKQTAKTLQNRMQQSKSLLYLATSNSSNSKWMPWELGYFDGLKPDRIAILPILDSSNSNFNGQEYLGIYPVVNKTNYTNGTPDIFVFDGSTRWSTLKRFSSGSPSWSNF